MTEITVGNVGSAGKFVIKFSPNLGRYLVAGEDLDCEEVIMDEVPLVVAPSGKYDWDRLSQRHIPICIGCLKTQITETGERFGKCPGCAWPVCEPTCSGLAKFHSQEECELFRSRGIIQTPRSLRMVYLIRCLIMKATRSKDWAKLLDLAARADVDAEEEEEEMRNSCGSSISQRRISGQDKQDYEFLTDACGLDEVTVDLVGKLNGVKMVNGFGFYNSEQDMSSRFYGMALYFQISMASHGCSPNLTTQVVYDPVQSFPMRFYTKTFVRKGEVLQIAYRDRWLCLGTLRRREKIFQDHKFWCHCTRCADPTENGTYFTAISCLNCDGEDHGENTGKTKSYLLPANPLDPESMWKCLNPDCAFVRTESEVSGLLEMATDQIEKCLEGSTEKRRIFEELSVVLSGTVINSLHPNNYLRVRAEVEWIRNFPFDAFLECEDENSTWDLFALLVERAQHCKDVYERLMPDWAEKNSIVDLSVGKAIFMYYVQSDRIFGLSRDLALDLMGITLKHLERGLRFEDPSSDSFAMAKTFCSLVSSTLVKLATRK